MTIKLSEEVDKLRKYNLLAEKIIEKVQDLPSKQMGGRSTTDLQQLLQSQEDATVMYDDLKFVCKFGKRKGGDLKRSAVDINLFIDETKIMLDRLMVDMKAMKAVMPVAKP